MVQKRREVRARVDSCELLLKLSSLTILCEHSVKIIMDTIKFIVVNFKEQNSAFKENLSINIPILRKTVVTRILLQNVTNDCNV